MSIKTYTVHHRSSDREGILAKPDELDFVKEGFSWPAFFLPLVWLIYKRMWIVLAFFILVSVCIGLLPKVLPVTPLAQAILGAGINLVMGFQGNDLLRWSLARRGRREIAVVMGDGLAGAEHRFFTGLVAGTGREIGSIPSGPAAREMPRGPIAPMAAGDYSILPEPGRV
ncbi:DUF2628 domain-containing protein [Rhodoligotrophos ferricapiens]|uniref:DUF2628 domain-containing protein n=1 Tax=Rhodoligotrophos ferricapiens TaxID=3069264 RepID=UPI00315C50EC